MTIPETEETVETDATQLFGFLQGSLGNPKAMTVLETVSDALFIAGNETRYPAEPLNGRDDIAVKTAIGRAIGQKVSEVVELSLSKPLGWSKPEWMPEEIFHSSLRTALSAIATNAWHNGRRWLSRLIEDRFAATGTGDIAEITRFNIFLNTKCEATLHSARAFRSIFEKRLGYMGGEFGACVENAVREILYRYIALEVAGNPDAADLEPLAKMIPFIVPICTVYDTKWIVIVP